MPLMPVDRQSLNKNLGGRYTLQPATSAGIEVKKRIGSPGSGPTPGSTMPARSMNSMRFQAPVDFWVKEVVGITQMLDAQGSISQQLSMHLRTFNNKRYCPTGRG